MFVVSGFVVENCYHVLRLSIGNDGLLVSQWTKKRDLLSDNRLLRN